MAQNRKAPAYQEYAAEMMAMTHYRVLSLQERGLLYTLRLECWVNGSLPADHATLARVLGFDVQEIAQALPRLRAFFVIAGGVLTCPELQDYREHLVERRAKLSEAGKRGAAKTNQRHHDPPAATPTATPRHGRGHLVEVSKDKHSQVQKRPIQVLNGGDIHDEWVKDFERHEASS